MYVNTYTQVFLFIFARECTRECVSEYVYVCA